MMSHIEPGDEDLHHSDNSHRHTAGPGHGEGEELARQRMAEHMLRHKALAGRETNAKPNPRVLWSH